MPEDPDHAAQNHKTPQRLADVILDSKTIMRSTPDIDHEREVAIFDLLEENYFRPVGFDAGPYILKLALQEQHLIFEIETVTGSNLVTHILSLGPFRRIVRDYFLICESYYSAIKNGSTNRIEAIDMGRRGIHNDGSALLQERLDGKIELDFDSARRLFTLVCVLHWRG
jgi:uncharacterized protein (UPF0262 family)